MTIDDRGTVNLHTHTTRPNEPSPNWSAYGLLRRKTSDGSFLPVVDGLRFLAISWVFLYHSAGFVAHKAYGHTEWPWGAGIDIERPSIETFFVQFASLGFFGVQLFFVISGFVLALPFARARLNIDSRAKVPTLSAYLLRRVTRLEPPYIFNLLFVAGLSVLLYKMPLADVLSSAGASLVYLHGDLYSGSPLNPVFWTLEIEVRFYLLAPLLALVFCIKSSLVRRILLVMAIIGGCILQLRLPSHLAHGNLLLNQVQYFLVGFLLADLYTSRPSIHLKAYTWDLFGLTGWTTLVIWLINAVDLSKPTHGALIHIGNCIAIFFAYSGVLFGKRLGNVLAWSPLFLLGGMCYTIYLWHYLIIGTFGRLLGAPWSAGSLGTSILINTIVLSIFSLPIWVVLFVTLERPFMDKTWPSRFGHSLVRRIRSLRNDNAAKE